MRTVDAAVAIFAGVCGIVGAVGFAMVGHCILSVAVGTTGVAQFVKGVRKLREIERANG